MSTVLSKALRADVLALAEDKRESTTASVEQMYRKHLQKAVKRRGQPMTAIEAKRITSKVVENLSI